MFEAFQFGPATVWLRLVFLLVAVWMSSAFFFRLAASAGLSLQSVKDEAKWHLLAFLLCGRLLAVVGNYQAYIRSWFRIFIFWDGGFSFLGGAVGTAVVLFWSTRKQRTTFLQWLDVLFPATTFGLMFDWFGMFLSSQAYGKPTNVPWGVVMDTFNVRYTVPIHPVQLYYAFFYLVLTFLLLLIRKHSKRAGAETLLGIVLSTVAVFMFEFFRGDFGIPVFAMFTDFVFLACLIGSLGVLALIEQRLTERANTVYGSVVAVLTVAYVFTRPWMEFPQYQLRFSQVLSILALLTTVVYVVVHRRKYPHL
jgi:phosphatidylglycerol---prolipoprotein diacylglyceryl transferase